MSTVKKIAYNTFIQIFGRVFSILFGVLTIGIVTRHLGVGGFGMYTKVFTFFQIFGVILDLGLYNVTLKLISHENDENSETIINKILTLRLLLNLFFLVVPFFCLFLNYELIVKQSIFIISGVFLFSNLSQIFSVLFQKKLDTGPIILSEIVARVLYFIFVFIIYKLDLGLTHIMIANILISVISFLILYFAIKKYIKIRLIFDKSFFKTALKMSWPFALSIIFNLIYFRADTFLLTILKSNEDVGMYSAAYKVLEIYIGIPSIFVALILPILDQSYKSKDLERFNKITQKIFDFFIMIIFPIIVGGSLLSKDVMALLAGQDFSGAAPILAILTIVMGIITMSALYTNTVIAVNEQKRMTFVYLLAAILSVILYGIFIPIYSYHLIPYLKIIIEGVVLVGAFILTQKNIKKMPSLRSLPKVLIASAFMGFGIYLLKIKFDCNIFLTLPAAVLIYFGILFSIGGIDKEIIKELLNKK